jgi:putative endonuclease
MYSVYIIYSEKIDKYYIGFSSNVHDRLLKHNRNSKGFSNTGKPWILVYEESFDIKKDAMARECQLKKWKNKQKKRPGYFLSSSSAFYMLELFSLNINTNIKFLL